MDLQFLVDTFYVKADCVETHAELSRCGFIVMTFYQQINIQKP
jgi:hypothetical protein